MTEDYITDIESEELPDMKSMVDELLKEPVIEELDEENEYIDDIIEKNRSYRMHRDNFPLDHLVLCGNCGFEGIVGFRQELCPRCMEKLIPPSQALGKITSRERKRP